MTTLDLARMVLPRARVAVRAARPRARELAGRSWLLVWPAWGFLTGPLLPLLVTIGVEIAVGLAAPQALPLVDLILPLATKYLPGEVSTFLAEVKELFLTPATRFCPPVRAALGVAVPLDDEGEDWPCVTI